MKPLAAGDYVVRPFITHKQQSYVYTHLGGGSPIQISVDLAVAPPGGWAFISSSEVQNSDATYQRPLYASVKNLFYNNVSARKTGFYPYDNQFYVVNINQSSYGEGIQRNTLRITSPTSTASLMDDGHGQIVSSINTGSVIGDVFYELGIVVLRQATGSFSASVVSHLGLNVTTGSQVVVGFRATHTIYEHRIACTLSEGEANYSTNPSMAGTGSDGIRIFDAYASGTLTPYMTSVGCYNDQGELVAVAKFPGPIKRAPETQQTFIIRFDV